MLALPAVSTLPSGTPRAWNTDPNKYRLDKVLRDHIERLLHSFDTGEVIVSCNAHCATPNCLLPRLTEPALAAGTQLDQYTILAGTYYCGGCGYCGLRTTLGATEPRSIGAPLFGYCEQVGLETEFTKQVLLICRPLLREMVLEGNS